MPISHAKTSEALDEEQRLLYVALSRAERVLHLSWARERTVGGRTARRNPSSWLARVDDAVHPGADAATPPSIDATPATGSPTPGRAAAAEGANRRRDGRRTALRGAGRLAPRQSRAASAPAYVIFPTPPSPRSPRPAPRTRRAARRPGVGPVKAERYGEAVLALVAEHAIARRQPGAH